MTAAIVLIVAGGLLYLLFRTKHVLFIKLLCDGGLEWAVDAVQSEEMQEWMMSTAAGRFVVESLPGGLWSAGYVVASVPYTRSDRTGEKLLWASVIPGMGVGSEIMQYYGMLPGMWDVRDIVSYAVPWIAFAAVEIYREKGDKEREEGREMGEEVNGVETKE